MSDEKHVYEIPETPPIPTYEEATSSSHPHPSSSRFGPREISDDAERQGLLASASGSRSGTSRYQPPSVQSVDDSDGDGEGAEVGEESALRRERREIEEMDYLDPEAGDESGGSRRGRRGGRLGMGFKKRFYRITDRLSEFHLPRIPKIKIPWPSVSFGWLTRRLPSIPEEYRPGWAIMARLCGLILIIALVYILMVSEIMPGTGSGAFGVQFNSEWVRQQAQGEVKSANIKENLKYISSFPHMGGSKGSLYLGEWIEGKFREAHMDTFTHDEYFVYMNYPREGGRRVSIVEPKDKAWEAQLEERSNFRPPKEHTPVFHGLSASGNVTGPLIYANYGSRDDFKALQEIGVSVGGAVVLMRYYGTESDRAMKVKNAQDAGAAAALIYSDPDDDGFKKGTPWPNGPWRPQNGVQRGTVALTSWIAGDVLTPGVPSTEDAKRMSKDMNPALPNIPSLPLSWGDAQKLLQSLTNIGKQVPDGWQGGVPDVHIPWFTGSIKESPQVNVQNFQDEVEKQPIRNVFGSFLGSEERSKKIIVGNHRDAWCLGAADPGSGTAVMLEVARVLGELRSQGWRPSRTIEFASWDAEEYNLIGSTEHVEANMDDLRANAVAYLNVDVGVTGPALWASGSPLLTQPFHRALKRVIDPSTNKTLSHRWDASHSSIGNLGAGSDYVAFQDMAGCSSFDFGFASEEEHRDMYHSCFETLEWVERFVDPGFEVHAALAQVWVLLILELAQEPVLPFNMHDYAVLMQREAEGLREWARGKSSNDSAQKTNNSPEKKEGQKGSYSEAMFEPLLAAIKTFLDHAAEFHEWEEIWYNQVYGAGGFESPALMIQRMAHNEKMTDFDTNLLDLPRNKDDKGAHGIPGREQYKHVVFGPDASGSGYDAAIFPFVRDAVEEGDWRLAAKQVNMTAGVITEAVKKLRNWR